MTAYDMRISDWSSDVCSSDLAMGLSYTGARGILAGIKSASTPFFRTPKCEDKPALMQGFLMAWQEMALFGTAVVAALATFAAYGPYNQEIGRAASRESG